MWVPEPGFSTVFAKALPAWTATPEVIKGHHFGVDGFDVDFWNRPYLQSPAVLHGPSSSPSSPVPIIAAEDTYGPSSGALVTPRVKMANQKPDQNGFLLLFLLLLLLHLKWSESSQAEEEGESPRCRRYILFTQAQLDVCASGIFVFPSRSLCIREEYCDR